MGPLTFSADPQPVLLHQIICFPEYQTPRCPEDIVT